MENANFTLVHIVMIIKFIRSRHNIHNLHDIVRSDSYITIKNQMLQIIIVKMNGHQMPVPKF